ncbi:hypothetical protein B0A55_02569 [Friedmanniomyces simplex]|uniref:Major facilitator superfamily (MFS) profile domain-containing protein n=1 Tax=Friedmanniomyces simplex TaxID=329884 RepID=A0A4U0XLP1_9PEZI|nr:hypothetical protein B0A55_02569 [Friedmanniomyces simplex]
MAGTRARPNSTASTLSASSLMQDVPGAFPSRSTASLPLNEQNVESNYVSLSQAIRARRGEYVRPKHVRIKIGSWNVAAYKGAEKDVGGWFVQGKGVTEELDGLSLRDHRTGDSHGSAQSGHSRMEEREDVAAQEARYAKKQSTLPKGDPGSLPGGEDIGLYVLCLQEVVDVNSVAEALRPYTDPSVAAKWKAAMLAALPARYALVAEQQLIGMLLLIYASPEVAKDVRSVSTTSVGTGIAGYMGNKGAVTARIVLGETTRLVFISCHLSAGADKAALERRNWDTSQIISRTRFDPIADSMDPHQTTGEQIGEEDFAFWAGDLNYRLEGIPGDDVRRLLMLHTRNEYDLSQRSARKIEKELQTATATVKRRVEDRLSVSSAGGSDNSSLSSLNVSTHDIPRTSEDSRASTDSTAPTTLLDEVAASEDPTSLQTTLASLLPHDELHQQMQGRKAFHDGWREGPIQFLPTYKYDAGSVGVFDSSEKKRAPSWCDRILYRTRRDRLTWESRIKDEEEAKRKDEEMRASGADEAAEDEEILYDYDPDADGVDVDEYDEYDDLAEANGTSVVTKEGFEDEIELEYYTAHQRVLSSDHKPLDAVFRMKYDCVIPELKAKIHALVAKQLDQAENESRPSVTVVVDRHRDSLTEQSDEDPAAFSGVWFSDVRWAKAKHRYLTIANTGRASATFSFVERPVAAPQSPGIAPKWINMKVNDEPAASSSHSTPAVTLEPGETASVELEVRIFDLHTMHGLNEGLQQLDDILVLRVEGGRDHFVPVRGHWLDNTLGRSLDKLTRIPEGGIRRLQRQKPGSKKGTPATSTSSSQVTTPMPEEQPPVRFSAPPALLALTAEIEMLSTRVVAEWDMIHPQASFESSESIENEALLPPWRKHLAWPFDEVCWTERTTSQWEDALGEACNALDQNESLEASLLPLELPRMQQLSVLVDLLMLFLKSMPDGIITADLWPQIEKCLAESERSKRKLSIDERRMAVQELLSQTPSHNISFILITSMVERILQETTSPSANTDKHSERPLSPTKRLGTLRRMTGLGRVPAAPSAAASDACRAMARVFADAVVRSPEAAGEKSRSGPTFLKLKGQNLVYAVVLCSSFGFLLFGYDLGFMGGLTTSPEFLNQFGNPNASLLGFLVSAYEVGAMFGALFVFLLGDRVGRKPTNIAGAVIVAIGAAIQTSSYGVGQFLAGRLIAGFGLGMCTSVIPVWLAECAMPKNRGRMMTMQLSNLIMGLIIANWVDYGMSFYAGSIQWRFPCSLQIVFCIMVCCFMPWLPESPRYLANVDRIGEATVCLAALRGDHPDTESIAMEMKEIQYAIAVESEETGSWADVFKDGGVSGFTRVAVAFSANFFQQLSGVNVMSSLGPYIFQVSIGMSRYDALLVSGGLQVFYFLSSLIPLAVAAFSCSIGMGTCMTLSAIFVGIGTKGLGYAAAVVLYLFQTFFTLGWQSNMWIYPSELLPLKLRLRGGAIAVISQWLWTFLVVEITPVMITNIGYKSYIVFAIINFITIPFVYFFYPETSRLPLEAVDLLFADRENGQRPSILRVVRDSTNKAFMAEVNATLEERARYGAETGEIEKPKVMAEVENASTV